MWKRELKIIESLGKLYPKIAGNINYEYYQTYIYGKAYWISWICRYHLNRRLPQLEEFIKDNNDWTWEYYKQYFNITDKECGKKN